MFYLPIRFLSQRIFGILINKCSQHQLIELINSFGGHITHAANRSIELTKQNPKEARSSVIAFLELETSTDHSVNKIASHYYLGQHPKHYLWTTHNDFIIENVQFGEKVIDIGCGSSEYTLRLAGKGARVLGIDINPDRIEFIKRHNKHPNLEYIRMDLLKEVPKTRFDVAVCSHVLEHLEDPIQLLTRIKRIASRLIVKVPRVDSGWKKLMKKDLGMFWFDDSDHCKEYTWEILLEELDKSGWKLKKRETGLDLRVVAEHKE